MKIYVVLMKEVHHWIFDQLFESVKINVMDSQVILDYDNQ